MSRYTPKIHTIDLGFLGKKSGIAAFLVELEQGPILVETGPHSTLPRLEKGINDAGFQLDDIKHVLITHIHLDHAGAAWCFAEKGATIYLHPKGYRHMHDPGKLLASAKMIYKEKMDMLWGSLKPINESQLIIVEHLESVNIGSSTFIAHHTPGHAQHHIAWQMDDVVFTGDVAGVSINNGPVIPPCPPPDINRELWLSSIDHLLTLTDVKQYYLTHFGLIENIEKHMAKLRSAIEAYTDFMKPFAEADKSPAETLPEFRTFVKSYLMDNGLNQKDADAYEAANPLDMSAAGLLRYWKKKWA